MSDSKCTIVLKCVVPFFSLNRKDELYNGIGEKFNLLFHKSDVQSEGAHTVQVK